MSELNKYILQYFGRIRVPPSPSLVWVKNVEGSHELKLFSERDVDRISLVGAKLIIGVLVF